MAKVLETVKIGEIEAVISEPIVRWVGEIVPEIIYRELCNKD